MAAFLSKAPSVKPKEESAAQTSSKHEEIKEVKRNEKNDKELHISDQNKVNGTNNEREGEIIENEKENSIKIVNSKTGVKNSSAVVKGKKVSFLVVIYHYISYIELFKVVENHNFSLVNCLCITFV